MNNPLLASMCAPAGKPGTNSNTRDCAGTSESVALTVRLTVWPSRMLRLWIGAICGGVFPPARTFTPGVPGRLEAVLIRMLARDPAHRYQACGELADDLAGSGLASQALGFLPPPKAR